MKRWLPALLLLTLCIAWTASASSRQTYKLDDYHQEIKEIQRRLFQLNYLDGDPDGWFGRKTYAAVRRFQRNHALEVTGIADEATQELLFSDQAKEGTPVLMSLSELKELLGQAGALGIRYDLSEMETDGRTASYELSNYVVLHCELLEGDVTEIQLIGTENVLIPFTVLLMALDQSIGSGIMYEALGQLAQEEQRVVENKVIRYEKDEQGIQRLIVTPLGRGSLAEPPA